MAILQRAYTQRIEKAYAGLIANMATCDVDSCRVEGSTNILFGVAVQQGTAGDQIMPGAADNKVRGITVRDMTLNPDQDDQYTQGDIAGVLWRGDIWAEAQSQVAAGNNVSAHSTTGRLSSIADTATGVLSIAVTVGGSGYDDNTPPAVTVANANTGTDHATAYAVVVGGVVTAIEVINPGAGYSSDPAVTVAAPTSGTTATATATRSTAATVISVSGARWMTAARGGELAIVRLAGLAQAS